MRRPVLVLTLAAVLLGAPPATASTGQVLYGYANSTWTQGRGAFTVSFDGCGGDGQPTCRWWGWAVVSPAAVGCESFPEFLDSSYSTVWLGPEQSANGTVASGEKPVYMNGAYGQRLCVYYARQFTGTGVYGAWLAHSKLMEPEPAPFIPTTPTPPTLPTAPTVPAVTLTARKAGKTARVALVDRFGRSWRNGTAKHLTCSKVKRKTAFACSARWRYHRKPKAAKVTVTLKGGVISTRVRVVTPRHARHFTDAG